MINFLKCQYFIYRVFFLSEFPVLVFTHEAFFFHAMVHFI